MLPVLKLFFKKGSFYIHMIKPSKYALILKNAPNMQAC